MKCLKKTTGQAPESIQIEDLGSFSLQECAPEEAEAVQTALNAGWYVKVSTECEEYDGGWTGYKTESSRYRDLIPEDAVMMGGAVAGFWLKGTYLPLDEAGTPKIHERGSYSFDHGDGDGESTTWYILKTED